MNILDKFKFWRSSGNDNGKDREIQGDARSRDSFNKRQPSGGDLEMNNRERERYRELSRELEELRNYTMDNMGDIADEFEMIREEVEDVRGKSSQIDRKMFSTVQKAVSRLDTVENRVENLERKVEEQDKEPESAQDVKKLERKLEKIEEELNSNSKTIEMEKKLNNMEKQFKSEIERLEKQKVDGKDLVNIDNGSKTENRSETMDKERKSTINLDNQDLTKKQQAKIKILEKLREGMGKTAIRKEIEGEICSREWFYKAWDELEKEEAYISGREEALIHPEDYKRDLVKEN